MYRNIGKVLSKNAPAILTGLSITGVAASAVLAARATPRAIDLIVEEEERLGGRLTPKETFLVTWKCYIPAALMFTVTSACILSSNSINTRRNVALAGLYSLSQKTIRDYKHGIARRFGDEKRAEIRKDIQADKLREHPIDDKEILLTGKGDTLCYDALSGRYFKSDMESIKQALNKLSRDLLTDNFITLNEIYSELGLKESKVGDMLGFHVDDGLIEAHFDSHITENGLPCLVMDFIGDTRPSPYI